MILAAFTELERRAPRASKSCLRQHALGPSLLAMPTSATGPHWTLEKGKEALCLQSPKPSK